MVSALTMLALDEMLARYAGYEELAELIRHRFADASATLRELYSRLVFNILCGNTDDHARNHAGQILLSRAQAIEIVSRQLTCIIDQWDTVCAEAALSVTDRTFLWGRQFLNPFAFEDLNGDAAHLKIMADTARSRAGG